MHCIEAERSSEVQPKGSHTSQNTFWSLFTTAVSRQNHSKKITARKGRRSRNIKKSIMFRPARAIDNWSSIIRGGNLQNQVSVVLTMNLFIETHN